MTQKLSISNVLKGEASIALRLAASTGIGDFILEGVILTVN
jgi:hypothetical protein